MDMTARTDHPVLDAVAARWSPYAYDPRPLAAADLRSIFEAARWSASSYNEQPWRFLVVAREDAAAFAAALDTLVEFNRNWARDAPVLVFAVAASSYEHNGKPNTKAEYDLGQAVAQLSLEAASRGIQSHQIGGLDPERARELLDVPADHEVVCAFTLGYPAEAKAGGAESRERRPLDTLVFGPGWRTRPAFLD